MKMPDKPIYITSPLLPSLEDLNRELKIIFSSKQLTNMGNYHNLLEQKLKDVLKLKGSLSLFNNGTIALMIALKVLNLAQGSEVITTPWTFAATPHCIVWNNLKPVFCDIKRDSMCIDPSQIEKHITKNTSAILGVHVYGFACDVEKIETIAKKYNLKVIYDAAHAFSSEIDAIGIGNFGDISMFSFHATKLFNTIEGGALAYPDKNLERQIYNFRNFGIRNEELVEEVGINGKLNELQAAVGLLNLKLFENEKQKRAKLKDFYDKTLSKIIGITIPKLASNIKNSYQYYPIIIENNFWTSRNELYDILRKVNIFTRKYFYPLCSDYECYKNLPSANAENLPVANELKNKVLCIPFYGDLPISIAEFICYKIAGN
ncbi:MAG: DegT/DnrJ/EryC1/StrS family aminotransferase [Elusimicrobiota bacterium]|jgi:dTDP-4-amino-4,6-dideoxygalactose transaminase|nr:DegT/DnrJ/EryC1/StrS family aminotransferase [Elusimicrobiota bacterium]